MIHGKRICTAGEVQLPGVHNLENICAAVTAAWQFTQDVDAITKAVTNFKGLPHRLQFVDSKHGVDYYDDSISTTPGSVIAALHAFEPSKTTLIIGGQYDKGVDFAGLAAEIAKLRPHKVLFVGPIGAAIANLARVAGYDSEVLEQWTMAKAVAVAAASAAENGVVVLSPACASFGDFKDYKDRGNQFIAAVSAL
jgi:UDP-N-acetylmuramoylalanine--D-glutamate ligase